MHKLKQGVNSKNWIISISVHKLFCNIVILQCVCGCGWKSSHTNSLKIHLYDLNNTFLTLKISIFPRELWVLSFWSFCSPIIRQLRLQNRALMWRALIWLNVYGCEVVWHELKNGLKTQKMHFYPFFELMAASPP